MNHKLLKNTTLYTIGMVFPKAAQFFLLPIYTRYLTPSDFGIIGSMQVINSILVILFSLSLNNAIYRLYHDFKSENEKKDYLGTLFIGVSIITIIITLVLFSFSSVVGRIYKSIPFYPYFSLSIAASAITSLFLVPKTNYFVKEKANIFIILSITEFLVRNGFIIFFVISLEKGAIGYLEGQLIGNIILLPFFLLLAFRQFNIKFVKSFFLKSINFSFPLLPVALSGWIMQSIDRVFIERYFGTEEVGIYTLGYKIAMLIVLFVDSFYKAYNPYFFKTIANNTYNEAVRKLKRTNTIYILLVIIIASIIALFAKEVVLLFFDERYLESYKIIVIVSIGLIFGKSSGILILSIYQSKKTSYLLRIFLSGAAANIGLNFLLIPDYGAYGAAIATVITFIFRLILFFYYAKKCFYPSFNHTMVYPLFALLVSGNLIFYFLNLPILLSIVVKVLFITSIAAFVWIKYHGEIIYILHKK